MSNNCKLCGRESTISIHNGLISCANPDCYMDEVEMPQEDWDSLMCPAQSLSDIRAEAVIEAADKVIRHNEHSFCIHCSLIDHANRIKEG